MDFLPYFRVESGLGVFLLPELWHMVFRYRLSCVGVGSYGGMKRGASSLLQPRRSRPFPSPEFILSVRQYGRQSFRFDGDQYAILPPTGSPSTGRRQLVEMRRLAKRVHAEDSSGIDEYAVQEQLSRILAAYSSATANDIRAFCNMWWTRPC